MNRLQLSFLNTKHDLHSMIKKDVFDDEDIPLLIFYVVCFFYKLIVANSQQNIILVSVSFLSTGGEIDNRRGIWRSNKRSQKIK